MLQCKVIDVCQGSIFDPYTAMNKNKLFRYLRWSLKPNHVRRFVIAYPRLFAFLLIAHAGLNDREKIGPPTASALIDSF